MAPGTTNAGDSKGRMSAGRGRNGLQAVALTQDHNPNNPSEAAAVRQRCPSDRNPLRASRGDIASHVSNPLVRVAGTLAVTRALGDAYLKEPAFTSSELKVHVPYITAEPEVSTHLLSSQDLFLVLATDGVWEVAANDRVVDWTQKFLHQAETRANDSARRRARSSRSSGRRGAESLSVSQEVGRSGVDCFRLLDRSSSTGLTPAVAAVVVAAAASHTDHRTGTLRGGCDQ